MKEIVKILCRNEVYRLGLETALHGENIKIIEELKGLSENDILITDRYFYNFNSKVKIIRIYDDLYKALLGSEKIRVLRNVTVDELIMALKAAKRNQSYLDSNIIKAQLERRELTEKIERLTIRERELLKGILNDMSNYEMSKILYLSEKTIKNNLTELYKKLSVINRVELKEKIYDIKL